MEGISSVLKTHGYLLYLLEMIILLQKCLIKNCLFCKACWIVQIIALPKNQKPDLKGLNLKLLLCIDRH